MRELICIITDPLGLHVQLAVLLSGEAERWRSRITVEHRGRTVDAKQLMEVMMLGARSGEQLTVTVEGADENTASEALQRLLAGF